MLSARPLCSDSDTLVFVLKTWHTHVRGEMLPRHRRHIVFGLIADADDGSALACKSANEEWHLIGIARRNHHDIHLLLRSLGTDFGLALGERRFGLMNLVGEMLLPKLARGSVMAVGRLEDARARPAH